MIGMTVCSGIGAPEVSAPWIDWRYQSEIEPFPCAVLAHRFPDAVNLGDMTKFQEWPDADVDVLVGGTPCQSFSVAGLRKGLADPRGNLALTYLAIAARYRPRWLVWENVPGVTSALSHASPDPRPPEIDLDGDNGPGDGTEIVVADEYRSVESHALWCFVAGAAKLGYHGGFRIIDAQHVQSHSLPHAVPQRRERVFFVGYLGDWRRAGAVLFEPEGLQGHPPPRRETRERPASLPASGVAISSGQRWWSESDIGATIRAQDSVTKADTLIASTGDVAHALRGEGFDASEDGTGRGTPLVPVAFGAQNSAAQGDDVCHDHSPPLSCTRTPAVAFSCKDYGGGKPGQGFPAIREGNAVRRLTPLECERLQGFPDGWTAIPYRGKPADQCPDGPRYKALGNSWATNCGEVIFDRIRFVESLT